MPRVKRGVIHTKHRANFQRAAKGFRWGRKSKIKLVKIAVTKAGAHAYRDRKRKKREFRALWQIQINAAVRAFDISYSVFMHGLKKQKVKIDRKILSKLAQEEPKVFEQIVALAKN